MENTFSATEYFKCMPDFGDDYSTEERIEVSALDVEYCFETAVEEFIDEDFGVIIKAGQRFSKSDSFACDIDDDYWVRLIVID